MTTPIYVARSLRHLIAYRSLINIFPLVITTGTDPGLGILGSLIPLRAELGHIISEPRPSPTPIRPPEADS